MTRRAAAALAVTLAGLLAAACGDVAETRPSAAAPATELLFVVEDLPEPRSVAWDSVRARWLVAGGSGEEGGFVAAIGAGGGVVDRRAYGGPGGAVRLRAPQGIHVRGDRAYLADGDRVVALDLRDRELAFELRIPPAERLHDVVVDERGIIYVSDPDGDAIFRVTPDGSAWNRMTTAGSLRGPSGLVADPRPDGAGRLLAAGREGAVVALNPDSSVALLAEAPTFGDFDGLERVSAGALAVSEPSEGRLLLLRPEAGSLAASGVSWLDGLARPGDFVLRDGVLAVPEEDADRVSFYRTTE